MSPLLPVVAKQSNLGLVFSLHVLFVRESVSKRVRGSKKAPIFVRRAIVIKFTRNELLTGDFEENPAVDLVGLRIEVSH